MTTNIPGPAPLGDKLRIAFLGPFGTFTEQAVHQVAPAGAILMPMTSAPQALAAVRRGEADRAVVPIENSIEGGVNATLDSLSHGDPLVIVAEMHVHVVFQLAVLPGTRAEDVRRIGTHPHAWAQCRGWVENTFPGAIHVPATSTAAAAELLSELLSASRQLSLNTERYTIPTDSQVDADYLAGLPQMASLVESVNNGRARTAQLGEAWPKTAEALYNAVQSALTGKASPQVALETAKADYLS